MIKACKEHVAALDIMHKVAVAKATNANVYATALPLEQRILARRGDFIKIFADTFLGEEQGNSLANHLFLF